MAAAKRALKPRDIKHVHMQAGPNYTVLVVETIDGRLFQYSFTRTAWLAYPPIPSDEPPPIA